MRSDEDSKITIILLPEGELQIYDTYVREWRWIVEEAASVQPKSQFKKIANRLRHPDVKILNHDGTPFEGIPEKNVYEAVFGDLDLDCQFFRRYLRAASVAGGDGLPLPLHFRRDPRRVLFIWLIMSVSREWRRRPDDDDRT